jgi:hypothetical protein
VGSDGEAASQRLAWAECLYRLRVARLLPRRVRHPTAYAKGSLVITDQTSDDIRSLFDWRNAPARTDGQACGTMCSPIANDDLALALQLLSCNSRDREQFAGTRGGSPSAA